MTGLARKPRCNARSTSDFPGLDGIRFVLSSSFLELLTESSNSGNNGIYFSISKEQSVNDVLLFECTRDSLQVVDSMARAVSHAAEWQMPLIKSVMNTGNRREAGKYRVGERGGTIPISKYSLMLTLLH